MKRVVTKKNLFLQGLTVLFFISSLQLSCLEKLSSYPYVCGNAFREYCDFVYDNQSTINNPSEIQPGNTVFVKTVRLEQFFKKIHPSIQHPYILITHNHDHSIPGKYAKYLDEDKLIAWFGINVENHVHPKLHPIPIGIMSARQKDHYVEIIDSIRAHIPNIPKSIVLYMNFSISTNSQEQGKVFDLFIRQPWCKHVEKTIFQNYANDVSQSKFVLSPRGIGIDCYRTWEAILLGSIPIVKTSSLDRLFDDLPVLIVEDWSAVSLELLDQKYAEMILKTYRTEKLYSDYWLKLIDSYK